MSILENIVSQISSNAIAGVTKPTGINLDDDTFAKLLEGMTKASSQETPAILDSQLGMPAGFEIEALDAVNTPAKININPAEFEIKDLKISDDFFSNAIKDNSNILNFAKKHAANSYNLFGKGFIDTLGEFVGDISSLTK